MHVCVCVGVFMTLHKPDSAMKKAPLKGLSVLIRGHYLYAVSRSWLVTSSRKPGWQSCSERQKREESGDGGLCLGAENVISRLGGETNSCCQPDLVEAVEGPE